MELKIFVNTWGNYRRNGADGGEWLTLPMDAEELEEKLDEIVEKMRDESPEWFVNDYATDIYDFTISEHDAHDIYELNELAEELDALSDDDIEKCAAILEAITRDIYKALDYMKDYQFFPDTTLEELAQEYIDDCDDIPDRWLPYIDVKMFARDLSFEGYTETANGVLLCY